MFDAKPSVRYRHPEFSLLVSRHYGFPRPSAFLGSWRTSGDIGFLGGLQALDEAHALARFACQEVSEGLPQLFFRAESPRV